MATPSITPQQGRLARAVTLVITYAIKMVGLAAAFNQLLLRPDPKALPLVIAAFMMAGAQFSEGAVLAVLEHFLVVPAVDPDKKAPR